MSGANRLDVPLGQRIEPEVMPSLTELQRRYEEFITDRGLDQFHTRKSLAEAISVEANELLELFLWHDNLDSMIIQQDDEMMNKIEAELADVVIYCLGMASRLEIDLLAAIEAKLDENKERFDDERAQAITNELETWQRSE